MSKVVLAYSGGLDTSVAIRWLQDKYGVEVIALAADVGQGSDLEFIKQKALKVGASKAYIVDAKEDFLKNYAFKALKANALYEGVYPLSASLSRPLISKLLVEVAEKEGAYAVAHGCTGKGNDQVRFDVSVTALNPSLKIIAPVREWPMSRDEEIDYAKENGIPVPVDKDNPFSIDQNLWGRSIECGVLEDPWVEPPEEAYIWTVPSSKAPDEPEYIEISFEKGVPVKLNGVKKSPVDLVAELHKIAGKHGVGRIDHVENRLVGIKSREVYECPAAEVLIKAHKALEFLTLPKETLHFKQLIDIKYSEMIYNGLWFTQLMEALNAFIDSTQEVVTGDVRIRLHKGNAVVVGRKSPYSLYDVDLATYDEGDQFDHKASEGFITLWGLPTKVYSMVKKAKS
ncbi:MAG: argininosuccinate synthase [Thermosediminibacterales bacterium]|nr:argininosuccinate synthase [Thermosediminibacterales bacterium]